MAPLNLLWGQKYGRSASINIVLASCLIDFVERLMWCNGLRGCTLCYLRWRGSGEGNGCERSVGELDYWTNKIPWEKLKSRQLTHKGKIGRVNKNVLGLRSKDDFTCLQCNYHLIVQPLAFATRTKDLPWLVRRYTKAWPKRSSEYRREENAPGFRRYLIVLGLALCT